MPYTRFTHDACHTAPASVPASAAAYPFTWTTIANYANTLNPNNPPQIAPALTSPAAQLFPFVNQGPVDVSGGHHDAGDYSKYTINSASLVHYLMFAVDSLPGVARSTISASPKAATASATSCRKPNGKRTSSRKCRMPTADSISSSIRRTANTNPT